MEDTTLLNAVPEALRASLLAHGITTLTPVQEAVLTAAPGRDLRISSQTGSGKTIAFGMVLGRDLPSLEKKGKGPRALVLVPTRELAQQVRRELAWLLAPVNLRVLVVTGGTSVRGDLVALAAGADVIVGTPGRLADHVRSGAVPCGGVGVVVLDEADEMLDMGFADELAIVLDAVPDERRMHLVSATFAEAVGALANRYQHNPAMIQGTPPGDANADIDHIVHAVLPHERLDALVNLLLMAPDEPTLIFSRTREGAATLARVLREIDLGALLLTGDLDQRERQRTLEMFRSGRLRILVATDVAARGLDVPGITRVIHSDPPEDPDAYTHRSGRTGRAGRKGTSHVMIPREARARVSRLLAHAGVSPRYAPIPGVDEILQAAEERALVAIREDDGPVDEGALRLARRLLEEGNPETLVARLLSRPVPRLPAEPRTVTPVILEARPSRKKDLAPRPARPGGPRDDSRDGGYDGPPSFVRFQVSWGSRNGADPRRVLALLCRRGGISREHVGPILVGPLSSFVDIRSDVAEPFENAARQPDPRDPRVHVRRARDDRSRDDYPRDDRPRDDRPRDDRPRTTRPGFRPEPPDAGPRRAEAPRVEAPRVEAPAAEAPRVETPRPEPVRAEPPRAAARAESAVEPSEPAAVEVPRPRASRSKRVVEPAPAAEAPPESPYSKPVRPAAAKPPTRRVVTKPAPTRTVAAKLRPARSAARPGDLKPKRKG